MLMKEVNHENSLFSLLSSLFSLLSPLSSLLSPLFSLPPALQPPAPHPPSADGGFPNVACHQYLVGRHGLRLYLDNIILT